MEPMFLPSAEKKPPEGAFAATIRGLEECGAPVPQIMRLFAYKPSVTGDLARFTQGAMRGDSPLAPGFRELIAAYTSTLNHCVF